MSDTKVKQIIVIVGPTASGKSDLAVKIAKQTGGEIVSADSRQVYRRMNVGTGKITKKEMRGIKHHLLDVISPKTDFNVAKFKKLALKKIGELSGRGKTPIVVGGTGFWVDALIYDWPIPKAGIDTKLRLRLDKKTAKQLYAQLKKLDPKRAAKVEPENKRRIVRALEIIMTSGKQISDFDILKSYNRKTFEHGGKKYKTIIIGLNPPREKLEQKIYKRLKKRLKQGLIDEIKKLHASGVSWKRLDGFGLKYRFVSRYLCGLTTYDQMVNQTYRAIKKYARRQMTWFRRNRNIKWFSNAKQTKKYITRQLKH